MKNLKRVLSLALSGVMLVGMMVMGASAVNAEDFTDASEITHATAVSISTALSIIDGKDDGSFDPNGNVTRGEMAKMITRAMFGGEDPVLGKKSTPTFTDISGRWDEDYIEYCANEGIINGRGDGTFDPTGNVTGTEAAKMLLVALGYKADIYGLTGIDWAVTTNSIANQTRVALYDELKGLDPNKAFTRDQVAQMIYNALNANTREMNPTMEITGAGDITYIYNDSGKTLLYDKYGAIRVEGVVKANEFSDNADGMVGKTKIEVSNGAEIEGELGLTAYAIQGNEYKMDVASGRDVFERAVIIYAKPASTNKKDLSKATVICDVIYDADNNEEYTTTDNEKMTDWPKDQGLKFDKYKDISNNTAYAIFYENYAKIADKPGDVTSSTGYGYLTTDGTTHNKANSRGVELTYIDNDGDGIINAVLRNTYAFGQVTKWSEKDDGSVTVRTQSQGLLAPSNAELKYVEAYDGVAVDDYVMTTKVAETYYLTKVETITGDLDAFENLTKAEESTAEIYSNTNKKTKSVTVDDDKHKVNQFTDAYTADGLKAVDDVAVANNLTEEVIIYLDNFGYAVAGECNASSEYLFVANAAVNDGADGPRSATLRAYVYLPDGTSGSYVVDKYSVDGSPDTYKDTFAIGTPSADVQAIKGKLFKYSFTSDDKLILTGADKASADSDNKTRDAVTYAQYDSTYKYSVDYDKDLSKLTVRDTKNTPSTVVDVKYVTMGTPVYFVSLKYDVNNDLVIDKVRVYTEKTAPSMSYNTGDNSNALVDTGTTKFFSGVSYVTDGDSSYDLDAVVFTHTQAVASDWLYLIEYIKTVDDGRIYWGVVDGEVVEVNTNDKTVRALPNAYGYSMDGDLYDLDDAAYNLSVVGEVSLVDSKSIIVNDPYDTDRDGTYRNEAKITGSTVTAYLDGEDSYVDVGIREGDVVALVWNESNEAEGIFLISEYDDTEADVAYTDPIVKNGDTTDYKISLAELKTRRGTASPNAVDLRSMFVVSGKADAKLVKADGTQVTSEPDGTAPYNSADTGTNYTAATSSDAVSSAETWYLLIKAEGVGVNDTNSSGKYVYTVKTIEIKA